MFFGVFHFSDVPDIIATWEGEANSFSANILNAIAKLIMVYGESLNDATFKEKLSSLSIKQLIRTAKERRPGMMGVAEVMVIEYNGRKKNGSVHRLPIRKLYEKAHKEKEPDVIDLFSEISAEPGAEDYEDGAEGGDIFADSQVGPTI